MKTQKQGEDKYILDDELIVSQDNPLVENATWESKDLDNTMHFANTLYVSAKMGKTLLQAKYFRTRSNIEQGKKDFTEFSEKGKLANRLGISVDELEQEQYQETIKQMKNSEDFSTFAEEVDKAKLKIDNWEEKVNVSRSAYKDLDKYRLEQIDGIDNKVGQIGTTFAGGLVEGLVDVTNLAKGVAMSMASGYIAGAYGLGTVGSWAVENTLDFAENYYTMKQEAKLLEQDLTTRDLIYGSLESLAMQNGIHLLKKGFKAALRSGDSKIANIKNPSATDNVSTNSTAKEVAKQAYNADVGDINAANKQLFNMKVEEDPNLKYNVALDPNNDRVDMFDKSYDNELYQNGNTYYQADVDTGVVKLVVDTPTTDTAKIDFGKGVITEEEYNDIIAKETRKILQKSEMGIDANDTIKIPEEAEIKNDQYKVKDTPTKTSIDSKDPMFFTSDHDGSITLIRNGNVGDFTTIKKDGFTINVFKNSNGDVVVIESEDAVLQDMFKNKPDMKNKTHEEQYYQNILSESRVSIIQPDGTIKSVLGTKKIDYANQFKRLQRVQTAIAAMIPTAERFQASENESTNRLGLGVIRALMNSSVVDSARALTQTADNIANKIVQRNKEIFTKTIGKYYQSIDQLLDDTNPQALAEMFVSGKTELPIFKKETTDNLTKTKLLSEWVENLINSNTFVEGIRSHENIALAALRDPEFNSKYGKIFYVDSDGQVSFNTKEGGFFHGKDITETLFDIILNPNKVDTGEYKSVFKDMDLFNFLIGDTITKERANGMALKLSLGKDPTKIKVLEDLGMVISELDEPMVTPESFVKGISNILNELINPDSNYNKDMLKNILHDFADQKKLPHQHIINPDGTTGSRTLSFYDYIVKNKNNGDLSKETIVKMIEPYMETLNKYIDQNTTDINKEIKSKYYDQKIDVLDKRDAKQIDDILQKWKKVFGEEHIVDEEAIATERKQRVANIKNETSELLQDVKNANETLINQKEKPYAVTEDNVIDTMANFNGAYKNNEDDLLYLKVLIDDFQELTTKYSQLENTNNSDKVQHIKKEIINKLLKMPFQDKLPSYNFILDKNIDRSNIREFKKFLTHTKKVLNKIEKEGDELSLLYDRLGSSLDPFVADDEHFKIINKILKLAEPYIDQTEKENFENVKYFLHNHNKIKNATDKINAQEKLLLDINKKIDEFIASGSDDVDTIKGFLENIKQNIPSDSKDKYNNVIKNLNNVDKIPQKEKPKTDINTYLNSEEFAKEKEKVIELSKKLNESQSDLVDIGALDLVEGAKYSGDISKDNISKKVSDTIAPILYADQYGKSAAMNIEDYQKITSKYSQYDQIGKKYDLGYFEKQILSSVKSVEDALHIDLGSDKWMSEDINTGNIKEFKKYLTQTYKEIKKIQKLSENAQLGYLDMNSYDKPFKPDKEHLKLIKDILKITEPYVVDDNKSTYLELKDYLDYHTGNYDENIPQNTMRDFIGELQNKISNFATDINTKETQEKASNYKELMDLYGNLRNIINTNRKEKSTYFFKDKNIDKIYNRIKELQNVLGIQDDSLDEVIKTTGLFKHVVDNINDSRKNSPLRNLSQRFIDGYRRLTSAEKQKFGRLESVINKKRWLSDKGWFNQTDKGIMEVLGEGYKDLKDVKEGAFGKFIKPEFQEKFKMLYEYAVDKFLPIEEIDPETKEVISSTPMTLDQFTVLYSYFLENLDRTTKENKIIDDFISDQGSGGGAIHIGALKRFFKSDEDMIKFFTNRQEFLGASYVKNNADIVYNFDRKTAKHLADYYTYGSSEYSFASRLNYNNTQVKNILSKNTIKENVNGVTIDKGQKNIYNRYLQAVSEKIMNKARLGYNSGDLRGVNQSNWETALVNVANFTKPFLIMGRGIKEITATYNRTLNSMIAIDKSGKYVGLGDKNLAIAYALATAKATGKGIASGGLSAGTTIAHTMVGTYNALVGFDRYIGIQNLINRYTGKNIDLRIDVSKKFNPAYIMSKLNKDQKIIMNALDNYFEIKDLAKRKNMADTNLYNIGWKEFKQNPKAYFSQAKGEFWDSFKETANIVQEHADIVRAVAAYENLNNIILDISGKTFDSLPDHIKASLRQFGITEVNFDRFRNTLNSFKTENDFLDVDLKNIASTLGDDFDSEIDIDMMDTIEAFSRFMFDKGFEPNKNFMYENSSKANLMKYIGSIFKNTTYGMGIEDMQDAFYDLTEYGTYEPKISTRNKPAAAWTTAKVGAATIPSKILGYLAIGMTAPVFDAIGSKAASIVTELSRTLGEMQTTIDIVNSDEDKGDKFFNGVALLGDVAISRFSDAFPITSIVNDGSVLEAYMPWMSDVIKETTNMLNKDLKWSEADINKFWNRFGFNVKYNELDNMDSNRSENVLALLGTLAGHTIVKYPYSYAKAFMDLKDYSIDRKNLSWLERTSPRSSYRTKEFYTKLTQLNSKKDLDKINIPAPAYSSMNDEGKIKTGMILYQNYYDSATENLQASVASYDTLAYGLNESLHNNEFKSDEDYNTSKLEIYKNRNYDKTIESLPKIYQYAIKKVLKSNDDISEIDKCELKGAMLSSIKDGKDANEILNKYLSNPINDKKDKKTYNKKYNSYDELPSLYKYVVQKNINLNEANKESIQKQVLELANQGMRANDIINNIRLNQKEQPIEEYNPQQTVYQSIDEDKVSQDNEPITKQTIDNSTINSPTFNNVKLSNNQSFSNIIFDTHLEDVKNIINKYGDISLDLKEVLLDKIKDPKTKEVKLAQVNSPDEYKEAMADAIINSPILNEEYKVEQDKGILAEESKPYPISGKDEEPNNTKKKKINKPVKQTVNDKKKEINKDKVVQDPEKTPKEKAIDKVRDIAKLRYSEKGQGVIPLDVAKDLIDEAKLPTTVKWIWKEMVDKSPKTGDANVKKYFTDAGYGYLAPTNNWCAALLSSAFKNTGVQLNKPTVGALAFAANGNKIKLSDSKIGDVLVFQNRKDGKKTWTGHVNMIVYKDDKHIIAIGGNQSSTDSKERDGEHNTINLKVYSNTDLQDRMKKSDLSLIRVTPSNKPNKKQTKTNSKNKTVIQDKKTTKK